jgi:Mrp family chromosome partitioning ATPase
MAMTYPKREFSVDMFEQALEPEAWKPIPQPGEGQVEASHQLGALARNVASYEPTPILEAYAAAAAQLDEPELEAPAIPAPVPEPPTARVRREPLPVWKLERPGELFTVFRPDCPRAYLEQFQLLRTQLLLMRAQCNTDAEFRCICLTSTSKGEGKTFTARNLAATLTVASGKKVLLIETAEREASVPHTVLGLDAALSEPSGWRACVAELASSGLSILTGPASGESIDFEPLPDLIAELKPHFDWIIVDAPAIQDAASAEWVVAAADAALLVVREGHTSFDGLADALARIPRGRLAGVVLNKIAPVRKKGWLPRLPKIRIRWSRRQL